jgi:hypothetical protein
VKTQANNILKPRSHYCKVLIYCYCEEARLINISYAVYIVDKKAMDYFDRAFDFSLFAEQPHPLNKDFYKATKVVIEKKKSPFQKIYL